MYTLSTETLYVSINGSSKIMTNATGLETEVSFIESNFKTNYYYDGLFALAKRLQTLILTEPNTIPNVPEMGVGIRLFLFSLNDDDTLNVIKERINYNINTFMPNLNILNIQLTKVNSNNTGRPDGIILKADLYDSKSPNAKEIIQQIGITFLSEKNSNVVSEIYL